MMKMLKPNIAIHCDTYDKSDMLLGFLINSGYNWSMSVGHACWYSYKENTCYCLSDSGNSIQYSGLDYFKENGYEIIEFEEFMKNAD